MMGNSPIPGRIAIACGASNPFPAPQPISLGRKHVVAQDLNEGNYATQRLKKRVGGICALCHRPWRNRNARRLPGRVGCPPPERPKRESTIARILGSFLPSAPQQTHRLGGERSHAPNRVKLQQPRGRSAPLLRRHQSELGGSSAFRTLVI